MPSFPTPNRPFAMQLNAWVVRHRTTNYIRFPTQFVNVNIHIFIYHCIYGSIKYSLNALITRPRIPNYIFPNPNLSISIYTYTYSYTLFHSSGILRIHIWIIGIVNGDPYLCLFVDYYGNTRPNYRSPLVYSFNHWNESWSSMIHHGDFGHEFLNISQIFN